MRRTFGIALALTLLLVPAVAVPVKSWGNGGFSADPTHPDYGIHDWIADKALTFQVSDVRFLLTTYHADYLVGTEAPDNGDYIGDSRNHHVYYNESRTLQSDVGASRARQLYQSALASLKSSDYKQAAYYAGAMSHYISDLGAYGHTMGTSTVWGSSPHHEEYEDDVHSLTQSLASPRATAIAWNDPYNETLSLALKTTFGSGEIKPNTWMESNFDWGNPAFRSSCLAALNESVRAVASALGFLLAQAGVGPVPEFSIDACVLILATTAIFAIALLRSREDSQ